MIDLLENINTYISDGAGVVSSINHAFIQIRDFCVSGLSVVSDLSDSLPFWLSALVSSLAAFGIITKIFHWG